MKQTESPILCHLPAFAGGQQHSPEISSERIPIDIHRVKQSDIPAATLLNAAWCLVLHLYTGQNGISFGSVNERGQTVMKTYILDRQDTLSDIIAQSDVSSVYDRENGGIHSLYNTVVRLTLALSNGDEHPKTSGFQTVGTGISNETQLAVQGLVNGNHLSECLVLFRLSFMSQAEAQNLAATLSHLMDELTRSDNKLIRDVLLSKRDQDQIKKWNDMRLSRSECLLHEAFTQVARQRPEAKAIDAWDGHLSFKGLEDASNYLGKQLIQEGVSPRSFVLLSFGKSLWAIVSWLAVLKAGAACVLLDYRLPAERIKQIIEKTGANHALADSATAAILGDLGVNVVQVPIQAAVSNGFHDNGGQNWPKTHPDDAACVVFTSGSTGTPKGVVLTHSSIYTTAEDLKFLEIKSNSRVLHFCSYAFDMSITEMVLSLLAGACLCIPSESDRVDRLQDYMQEAHVTFAIFTPTMARLLDPTTLPDMKTVLLGGELVREPDTRPWIDAGVQVYDGYGPAEATFVATVTRRLLVGHARSIGRGLNTRTWIVDTSRGQLVPVGAVGELVIESPTLALGYLNDPDKTAESFIVNPSWAQLDIPDATLHRRFYKTGDLARYLSDGSLECVGRLDAQVKLGGQRVELLDIEHHLRRNTSILDSAVVLPKCGPLAGRLTAVVVTGYNSTVTNGDGDTFHPCDDVFVSEAKAQLLQAVASYMVPSLWLQIHSLPLLRNGKLDRTTLLRKIETLGSESSTFLFGKDAVPEVGEANEVSEMLRRICSDVLNIPLNRVNVGKSFVALGGDSITAMKVVSTLRLDGKLLRIKDLLSSSSLREAASRVGDLDVRQSLPTSRAGERFPTSPIQQLFLETSGTDSAKNHFHQSVTLKLGAQKDPRVVDKAIADIVARHPMLRARFEQEAHGRWVQYITEDIDASYGFEYHMDTNPDLRTELMRKSRLSLSIEYGPMVRARMYENGGTQYLFLVIHHLVVDLVSWRIILEELETALTESQPTFVTSFPFLAWVNQQRDFAHTIPRDRLLPQPVPASNFAFWGIEKKKNIYADVCEKSFSVSSDITNDVLYNCHHALQTEPIDILIAALFLSFGIAFPETQLPAIFTEAHGREPWNDAIDLSRTVGWFTTMYPICVADVKDILDLVMKVKDVRKRTPNNGFEYFSTSILTGEGRQAFEEQFPAEIVFNYEGRYQLLEKEGSLLQREAWAAGETLDDMNPSLQRFCLFEIAASILDDCLQFTFAWNSKLRHQSRIELWLAGIPRAIEQITTTLSSSSRRLTLSDLDQFEISYSELETMTDTIRRIPGIRSLEDVERVCPCTPMQESLAISQARDENFYEVDILWQVTSTNGAKVDPSRLEEAWRSIVSHHTALRAVFIETPATIGILDQVILKNHDPQCERIHARDAKEALEVLANYPDKPKGLGRTEPPHRLLICSTEDDCVFMRFEINHIVCDGLSFINILHDLSLAYEGRLATKWNSPYADFIRYIRDPKLRDESTSYWKQYLTGTEPCIFPPLLDITNEEHERKTALVSLDITHKQLQDKVAELGVTFPVVMQLVWLIVLRFYTNSNQTVTGYLGTGRGVPVAGIEGEVGPFISMLLCVIDFTQPRAMTELLRKLQEDSINGAAHPASSLAEIQKAIGITGGALFNAGISFMPLVDERVQQGACLFFEEKSIKDPTEFELALIVESGEDATRISINYHTSLISHGHATNIAATINHILTEVLQDPSRTPDEISTLSSHDLRQLWEWNKVCIEPVEKCVHHFVEQTMKEHPNKEAIFSWDGSMSYRELDDLSRNLAHHIKSLGIGPEKIVPLCFEKSKWAIVSMLAVLRAGACFVMLDPAHPNVRVMSIAEEVEAEVLLCSPLTRPKFEAIRDMVVVVDSEFAHALPPADPTRPVCPEVTPDNAMYVVFTSGTTGAPKGSITSHRAYCTGFKEHAWAIEVGPETRSLQFWAYSFDACVGDIMTTLLVGGCICIPSEEDLNAEISNFISKSRATWAGWTPSFASLIDPDTVPTLTVLLMAGEPLPASQVDAWVDRLKLLNIYGPSECSVACVVNKNVARNTNASNIGRGYRCVTWVVDENDHERLRPIGSVGELLIEGPILARGYLKRPEKTAEVFIDAPSWLKNGPHPRTNRLYKTGDLVRYNSDGTINFIGRKDTQLKINGQRVEIGEIEHSLRSSVPPTAGPIVVDLLKRSSGGEQDLLAAFIQVGTDNTSPKDADDFIATDPSALRKFHSLVKQIFETASSLPRYMSPHVFIPVKKLPINTSGKLDRQALQRVTRRLSRDELVSFTSGAKDAGRTHEERQLVDIWKKVLQVSSVGIQDNFFRLGGDSIVAISLRTEARRRGLMISVSDVFSNPILADMAQKMGKVVTASAVEVVEPFSLLEGYESIPDLIADVSQECNVSKDAIEDILPSVPIQEALMSLSARQSWAQAYVLHAPYKLPVDLDEIRFRRAWEKTTEVHGILRSRIVSRPKGALLVIMRDAIPVSTHVGSLQEYIFQEKQKAFGYGIPLLRLGLVREGNDRYFVFSAHHAIYDGWSAKLMWDTVIQHYRGEALDVAPQFQTLVQKLRATPRGPSEDYWRQTAIDRQGIQFPSVPALHKPVTRSVTSFKFPLATASASTRNVTSATVINAAWAIVNAQYSADSTATYGCVLSGRDFPLPGIEQLVGPTVVIVPRQFSVRGDQSLSDFLDYVQRVAVDSMPHQNLGLSDIQNVSSAAAEAYNFTSYMVVQPDAALRLPFEDIKITPVPLETTEDTYPLVVEFGTGDGMLSVDVKFDPECIDLDLINNVMYHFDHVLQSICNASPVAAVADVMNISKKDLSRIESWNSGNLNVVECCVQHLIEKKVQEQPNHPALVSHDASLSYAEMDRWTNQIAKQIIATNLIKPGEFVGLCFDKSARAILAMIAVLKAGGAFLPLNPNHPPARLRALLKEADVKLVLASLDRASSLTEDLHDEVLHICDFRPSEETEAPLDVGVTPAHAAYLLFTSGSTGKPKGVVMEHRAFASSIVAQSNHFDFGPNTRTFQFCSYTFDLMLLEIFGTLISGGCVCTPSESERMNDISGYIRRENVNAILATPSVIRLIDPAEVPRLRFILWGGEQLARSDVEPWLSRPGVSLVNAYGPTETCILNTARNITPAYSSSNIGTSMNAATWVISPFSRTLAPIGAVGELCIEGPTLARGYLGDPERTEMVFERNPPCFPKKHDRRIYHTGDLARYNEDGSLTLLGRTDDQVKFQGHRIETGEIEENVREIMSDNPLFKDVGVELSDSPERRNQPFIAALLVMAIPYSDRISGVGCASMMNPSKPSLLKTANYLQQQLRNRLPEYMVPSAYVAVENLPMTNSGKRDRRFIKAYLSELSTKSLLFRTNAKDGDSFRLSGREKLLRDWWAEILNIETEKIAADDHFFALGGNSIKAIRLAGLARSSKHRLMFEDIFSFPILSEMASRVTASNGLEKPVPQPFGLLSTTQLDAIFGHIIPLYGISKEEVEDIYPCTPLQEGLMAATARNPGAYISLETTEISEVELPRLQQAWRAAFKKFEILRTRIVLSHDYGSLQVVVRQEPIWHEATDVQGFLHFVQKSYGYGRPMVHHAVIPTSKPGIVKLAFSSHHSVYDGWSLELVHEFVEKQFTLDPARSDTFQTVPFKLFISHLIDIDLDEAKSYWRKKMAGLEASPFPRPPHGSTHKPLATAVLRQTIPLPRTRKQGFTGTMATTVRAAWSLTISHYTANSDTLFGSVLTGRENTDIVDIEKVAGPTIATVPTRTNVDYESTVSNFLAEIQRNSVTESRFSQLGLQGIARISPECHQSCQFGSLLVVQPPSASGIGKTPHLTPVSVELPQFFPQALVLECTPSDNNDNVSVTLSYDPKMVGDTHVAFIISTFSTLLCNLFSASPHTLLRDLTGLSKDHISEIGSTTGKKNPETIDSCIHELVERQVKSSPANIAIHSWDGSMTYAELDAASSLLAQKLQKIDFGPEKTTPFMFDKSKWAIVSMLAIWKAGGSFVPLDPKSPNQRLQHIIQATGATIILTSSPYCDRCRDLECTPVLVDDDTVSALSEVADTMQPTVGTHNLAYILFTSGTTGTPKGVMVEHGSLSSSITALGKCMDLDTETRFLQSCAFTFDVMLLDTFAALVHGGCVCVPSEHQKMNDLVGFIQSFQVNTTWFTTSLSRIIDPDSVPSLKVVMIGGEAVLQSDVDRWAPKVRLIAGYGPTEACIVTLAGELTPSTPPNTIGRPVVCRAWVVNPFKSSELAPIGGIGELYVDGPCVARGYLGNEEATRAAFLEAPSWLPQSSPGTKVYRTGDFVYYNTDGTLSFFGRKDSQVKIRGQRVELAEIEEAIRHNIPNWLTVAVDIFKPGGDDKQILAAVFGVDDMFKDAASDRQLSSNLANFMKELSYTLRRRLSKTLPGHMIPDAYVPLSKLPTQNSGKLDRGALQAVISSMSFKSIATYSEADSTVQKPQTENEIVLARHWCTVLGISDENSLSTSNNFFSLGGDSILAMRVVALLRSEGYSLDVGQMFSSPQLSEMASKMQKTGNGSQQAVSEPPQPAISAADSAVLRTKIANNHNTQLGRMEDAYPCTDTQESFMEDSIQVPGAHVVQWIFTLDEKINLTRLHHAIDRCVLAFPILRTRIVRESTQLYQVVFSDKLIWQEFSETSLDSVLKSDKLIPTGLGDALTRVSIVHKTGDSGIHLIWTLHHALYDAWTLRLLLDSVCKAYRDEALHIVDQLPMRRLIKEIQRRDVTADRSFWASYLAGAGNSPLFGYLFVRNPIKDMRADYQLPLPQKVKGTTLAATIASAWIRVVGSLTRSQDVTIGYVVNGRAASIPGIQNCVGAVIHKVPIRVRVESGNSTADVSEKVQDQFTRLMPYELSGLGTVKSASQDACDACRFPLELTIHPRGTLFFASEDIGMRFEGVEVSKPPPGGFSVECSIKDDCIGIAAFWDKRAARKEQIDALLEGFKTVLMVA
ncbi:uncharacterized protein LY79DRAFT_632018 [Colletotrichum navitas]|uniref:Carrier domain-containing protein n=1 Tax=Colletotrichum navitas TaxID=681940 RepID=A0AAD8PZZ2_9PEZI|nr:uncharacterized protein LY79DRAFT_632018 [Colletotrichum navitas]KAK1590723.1 hypothetical protein LY79DRAFT_632018 [Colletotrichum navitas]